MDNPVLTLDHYKYIRPDIEEFEKEFLALLKDFKNSCSFEEQKNCFLKLLDLRNHFDTMSTLAHIRHTLNVTDKFYDSENNYFDEVSPKYVSFITKYYYEILNSKYREELEKEYGSQLFKLAEINLKTFSPEVLEDLKVENKLVSKYVKLLASAKISYKNEERNLSQMASFYQNKDRSVRKEAQEVVTEFFVKHEEELDKIYDDLVKVRDKIAKKLGFENFIELGYARMGRSDYGSEEVKVFRKQILEIVTPLVKELIKKQAKRLNLESIKYYDQPLYFLEGNAKLKGSPQDIVSSGEQMYTELSSETEEFFKFMKNRELFDLVARKNKVGREYMTYLVDYKSPFILSNFNGTLSDVFVLTHEMGHAFQAYCCKDEKIEEYLAPTLESCEIHSMSMELITWPWMNLFFEEDKKYKFIHLASSLRILPYIAVVDEFQHWVYENPQATPFERKKFWRETEKKYQPHKDYEDNDFLNRGGFWFRQSHIFKAPFYYIDYALAQICAFQFWNKFEEDRKKAWENYLSLCKVGGKKSFLDLLKTVELLNPFEEGTISSAVDPVKKWLDDFDFSK